MWDIGVLVIVLIFSFLCQPQSSQTTESSAWARESAFHHGKIEDAVIRAVIHDADGIKLQVDVGRSRPDGAD
jgi:hypothetical protein